MLVRGRLQSAERDSITYLSSPSPSDYSNWINLDTKMMRLGFGDWKWILMCVVLRVEFRPISSVSGTAMAYSLNMSSGMIYEVQ